MADAKTDGGRAEVDRIDAPAAPPSLAAANISIHVRGDNQGTIVVGNHNIVRQTIHGAVLVKNPDAVAIRPRSLPIIRPRPVSGFLGRVDEGRKADEAVLSVAALNFYGGDGWGKSALLRHLAHRFDVKAALAGIVFDVAAGHGIDDILQFLFDSFYVAYADQGGGTTINFKPTPGQLAHLLQPLRALIILDDVELGRDAAEALTNAAPSCAFLLASRERALAVAGGAVRLRGLAANDCIRLMQQELGRPLADDELQPARRNCAAVEGRPLAVIQLAAVMRDRHEEQVATVTAQLQAGDKRVLERQLIASLRPPARAVLAVLALLAGAPVRPQDAAAITGQADSVPDIEHLEDVGLVQATGDGFVLDLSSPAALQDELDADQWSSRAVNHYADWAEQQAGSQHRLLLAWRTLLTVLRLAATREWWSAVWRLVRALEPALMLSGRWGAWELVLLQGLDATRRLADARGEAWCLHQLGTRALALGNVEVAVSYLEQALEIRSSLKGRGAAAATRRNLGRIRPPRSWWPAVAAGAVVFVIAAGVGVAIATSTSKSALPIRLPPLPLIAASSSPTDYPPTSGQPVPAARIITSPAEVDLGSRFLGEPATPRTVTVKNQGTADAVISARQVTGAFAITQDRCPVPGQALKPGASCTIEVRFEPKSAGQFSGQLQLTDSAGDHHVALMGVARPPLSFSTTSLDFGGQAIGSTSPAKEASLVNLSGVPQTYTISGTTPSAFFAGPPPLFMVASRCLGGSYPLPPKGSCLTTVTFTPQAVGTAKAAVTVVDAYGDNFVLSLSGVGRAPVPVFTPASLDFGTVKQLSPVRKTVVLTNSGSTDLVVKSVAVSTTKRPSDVTIGGFAISADGCSGTTVLAAGCTVEVTFYDRPVGDYIGQLTFTDNAPGGSQTVSLSASVR